MAGCTYDSGVGDGWMDGRVIIDSTNAWIKRILVPTSCIGSKAVCSFICGYRDQLLRFLNIER